MEQPEIQEILGPEIDAKATLAALRDEDEADLKAAKPPPTPILVKPLVIAYVSKTDHPDGGVLLTVQCGATNIRIRCDEAVTP